MPKMSRPLVGIAAMSSWVSVDRLELSATWTGRDFRGDRDGFGDAADLQRQLAEVADFRRQQR